MQDTEKLWQEIEAIKQRNYNVEGDKAWETSLARKVCITLVTYIVVTAYLHVIDVRPAYLHAIVPALAFLLSTLTLPLAKQLWIRHIYWPKQRRRHSEE